MWLVPHVAARVTSGVAYPDRILPVGPPIWLTYVPKPVVLYTWATDAGTTTWEVSVEWW